MFDILKAVILSAALMVLGLLAAALAATLLPFAIFAVIAFTIWVIIRIEKAGRGPPRDRE